MQVEYREVVGGHLEVHLSVYRDGLGVHLGDVSVVGHMDQRIVVAVHRDVQCGVSVIGPVADLDQVCVISIVGAGLYDDGNGVARSITGGIQLDDDP